MTPLRRLALAGGLLLVALGVFLAGLVALRQPMSGGDYVAIWGLKAKALYRSGDAATLLRVDPEGHFSHPEYPPLWPLVLAGVSRIAGRYDELLLGALWPLLCAAAAASTGLSTRAPPELRLASAAALALLPYYRTPLYVGYAEALLLVFLVPAVAAATRAAEAETPTAALRATAAAAALFTLAAWTKQEGVLAGVVAAAVLLGAGRVRPAAAIGASVVLLGLLPWQLYVAMRAPRPPARDFALAAFDLGRLGPTASALVREALLAHLPWLLGVGLLLGLAPGVRRARRGLLAGVLVYAILLFLSFAFTVRDPAWHVRWTWDRLALPCVVVLLPPLVEAAWEAMRGDAEPSGA